MDLTKTIIDNKGVCTLAVDKFAEVSWTEDDLANALDVQDWPHTDHNILKLWEHINTEELEEAMISAGWDYIYEKIWEAEKELEDYEGHIKEED